MAPMFNETLAMVRCVNQVCLTADFASNIMYIFVMKMVWGL